MNPYPYILELAHGLLKICKACHGLGQQKSMSMPQMSVNDVKESCKGGILVDYSYRIIRCDECVGTGEKIDWDKWCELKQNNPWHVIQEVEKIFDNYFQEVPQ